MDGAVGPVSQQVSPPLVVRPATTQPEGSRSRTESPQSVARTEDPESQGEPRRIVQAVELANAAAELFDRRISFNYDERINQVIVRVIRESTEEVIRQIPPEEMVELMAKLRKDLRGLLLNSTG